MLASMNMRKEQLAFKALEAISALKRLTLSLAFLWNTELKQSV